MSELSRSSIIEDLALPEAEGQSLYAWAQNVIGQLGEDRSTETESRFVAEWDTADSSLVLCKNVYGGNKTIFKLQVTPSDGEMTQFLYKAGSIGVSTYDRAWVQTSGTNTKNQQLMRQYLRTSYIETPDGTTNALVDDIFWKIAGHMVLDELLETSPYPIISSDTPLEQTLKRRKAITQVQTSWFRAPESLLAAITDEAV